MKFIIALILLFFIGEVVYGWTTDNLDIIYQNGDAFYNYDFESQSVSEDNVDFPVNIIFWNNAEVDKIKNLFYGWALGYSMNMKLKDGSLWVWDSDKGSAKCYLMGIRTHMRLYADSDDRMYDLGVGLLCSCNQSL